MADRADLRGRKGTGRGAYQPLDVARALDAARTPTARARRPHPVLRGPASLHDDRRAGDSVRERVIPRVPGKTLARRLVEAQHTAAILTTFNEIDMSGVLAMRDRYQDDHQAAWREAGLHGLFVKATIEALKAFRP